MWLRNLDFSLLNGTSTQSSGDTENDLSHQGDGTFNGRVCSVNSCVIAVCSPTRILVTYTIYFSTRGPMQLQYAQFHEQRTRTHSLIVERHGTVPSHVDADVVLDLPRETAESGTRKGGFGSRLAVKYHPQSNVSNVRGSATRATSWLCISGATNQMELWIRLTVDSDLPSFTSFGNGSNSNGYFRRLTQRTGVLNGNILTNTYVFPTSRVSLREPGVTGLRSHTFAWYET